MPGIASSSALGALRIASEEPNLSKSVLYVLIPIPFVMLKRKRASNSVNAVFLVLNRFA
jgi:hypothetical protein